ncbi:MAG: flagellar basal-body rod protein FlgG [Proteobacteria bacterium]|nr:flagellar basal-body rod protein FlgG [Pseudomonadota bacterium]
MNALRTAATGMLAQQTNVDVLSNNIANLNTTGFKRQKSAFRDLIYQAPIAVGALTSNNATASPTGAQVGLGVNIGSIYKIMEQGNLTKTENTFDLGIQGRGFFRINLPDGTFAYTRDGAFNIDNTGTLVTKEGYTVDPNIVIPDDALEVSISDLGVVSAKVGGVVTNLGQLQLTMFINEAGLENMGNNYYKETDVSGVGVPNNPNENGTGTLLQGFLESSNVDPITAVTDLISAQRAYELNSRVISTVDEMLNSVNQIR